MKRMTLKDAFKDTIKCVFGEEIWNNEDLQKKYKKILELSESKEICGKYGDDASTIDLMLYLRKLMRDTDLVPNISMDKNIEEFINIKIPEKDNWLTEIYKVRFPESYNSEPASHLNGDYDVDGWNYENVDNFDRDIEWIGNYHEYKNTHFYYNQLDHYLTYLVGYIRIGKTINDGIKKGCTIKKDLFQ